MMSYECSFRLGITCRFLRVQFVGIVTLQPVLLGLQSNLICYTYALFKCALLIRFGPHDVTQKIRIISVYVTISVTATLVICYY